MLILTPEGGFLFELALWFLGLMDILWRKADVSREAVNSAGVLKSTGSSAAAGDE